MLTAIRQWVIKTMTKGQTGVVTTMPKQQIIEMNTQITAERIMRNGINPEDLKTVGQVENVINQIDTPKVISADSAEGKGITEQFLGKKKADVMDMEGNKIPDGAKIMGGKEVKPIDKLQNYTKSDEEIIQDLVDQKFGKGYFDDVDGSKAAIKDAAIKARLDASNKKGIAGIKISLVDDSIAKIKSMEPMDAMKEANLVAGKKGVYKNLDDNQVKKIIDDTNDHIFERDIPDEDFATGGRVGLKGGSGFLKFLKKFKVKQSGDDVKEFLSKRKFMKDLVGNTEKAKKARELRMLKEAMEKARAEDGFKFKDVDVDKDIRPIFDQSKDRTLNSDGGRIGLSKGGGLLKLLNFFNKKSPLQFSKDYLKNVKEKTLKANETGKFMDLPLAEVGIPATTGALVNNQIRKKLKSMNEEQKEENLKRFIMELENDEFYQKYPDLKDETIANYTEKLFGEKKADGGRIGRGGGGSMGATDRGYQGGGRNKSGGVSGTAPGAAAVGGGPEDRSNFTQNVNHRESMRNYQRPTESKIKKTINLGGDISYLKNLIDFNPAGIAKNIGGKFLIDKFLGDQSNLETEDEYSAIKGQMAGLNQEQVDFLDKIGKRNQAVNNNDFYTYDTPTSIKNKIEDLNSKSTNIFGTFKPDKIVEGDKNTFATDQDVEKYMKDTYKLGTGNNTLGLADGGRIGYKAGSVDKMRRLILKAMGAGTVGVGAAKSGIFSFGKGAGKTVAKEVAQQTTSSMPPPYFFKLAEKIKNMGNDVTATTDRTIAKSLKSKDGKSEYLLEQDVSTGDTIIKKINKEGDEMITDVEIMELKKGEVVMGKNGKSVKVPDEYEEVTESNARIEGDVFNDPYYSDGIEVDEIIKEVDDKVPSIKYASGGLAYMLGE